MEMVEKIGEKELHAKYEDNTYIESKIFYNIIKNIFDFIMSFAASIILIIPCVIIALIIFITDPGNPFFEQERIGKNGKIIKMVKFRSMKKNAGNLKDMLTPEEYEEYLKEFKLDNDPRLLPHGIGKIIRKTSLDELPQILFNVFLRRNMSFVGPRPILREEMDLNYTPEQQKLLTSVKPGITGYWQAYGRNNVGYKDGRRQEMELYYARNCSVWMDIKVLFKTVYAVIKSEGAK